MIDKVSVSEKDSRTNVVTKAHLHFVAPIFADWLPFHIDSFRYCDGNIALCSVAFRMSPALDIGSRAPLASGFEEQINVFGIHILI